MKKGYSFDKNRNQWMVRISVNNKSYFLGRYQWEEQAKIVSLLAQLTKDVIFSGQDC